MLATTRRYNTDDATWPELPMPSNGLSRVTLDPDTSLATTIPTTTQTKIANQETIAMPASCKSLTAPGTVNESAGDLRLAVHTGNSTIQVTGGNKYSAQ